MCTQLIFLKANHAIFSFFSFSKLSKNAKIQLILSAYEKINKKYAQIMETI